MARKRLFDPSVDYQKIQAASSRQAYIDDETLVVILNGTKRTWYFDRIGAPKLARDFAELLMQMAQSSEYFVSIKTLEGYQHHISRFIKRLISGRSAETIRLRDIGINAIYAWDRPDMKMSDWQTLSCVVRCLRSAAALTPALLSKEIRSAAGQSRLQYVSKYPKPEAPLPRDSYSPGVIKQIQAAAKLEVSNTMSRLRPALNRIDELLQASDNLEARARLSRDELAMLSLLRPPLEDDLSDSVRRIRDEREARAALSAETLETIALRLTRGDSRRSIEQDLELKNSHLLRALERFSPEFIELRRRHQAEYITETRQLIKKKRRRQEVAATSHAKIVKHFDGQEQLESQLALREQVLASWLDAGIPDDFLGSVTFGIKSVLSWSDRKKLGAINISRECRLRRREPQIAAHADRITEILERLSNRYGSHGSWAGHLSRNAVLEDCLTKRSGSTPEGLKTCNLNGFRLWTTPSFPKALKGYQVEKEHPLYGELATWSDRLLRATAYANLEQNAASEGSRAEEEAPRLIELSRRIAASRDELVIFLMLLLSLQDADVSSMVGLKRGCLENEAGGTADLVFVKPRAGYAEQSPRVLDKGLMTVGGAVRAIRAATRAPHEAFSAVGSPHAENLFLTFHMASAQTFSLSHADRCIREFCARHEIIDDKGNRLTSISLSRFRKSHKAKKYVEADGSVAAIADDNSLSIAAKHYANIPALALRHDKTVEAGLQSALDRIQLRVFPDLKSVDACARELSATTGRTLRQTESCLQGRQDVWLAGCLAFRESPFAPRGVECPTPFTECLHCANSIYTERKLPNLLRYRNFMVFRRQTMPPETWDETFGEDFFAIVELVLPRFSEEQIQSASEAIAKDKDLGELYIPLEIRAAL